ncbi:MAG: DUF87 domain-containing protein [Chloroflexota bacterium]|nr:DUF87 domain-containing protein [Chloroflexota bacterium]
MSASDEQGKLYLGREYDLKKGAVTDRPVLYEARHLTTHGVILGMTGSGKTGLGIILLEEALLQGTPVLILDPKGDMTNLLLTFPELRAEDFTPWVDLEGARRKGMSVEEYAEREARKWRDGLAGWDISGERIARLCQAAQFTIFTPGSEAGQPVDVLHFFDTPDLDWDEHEEALRERIGGIVSALLGLVGVEADPLQSPEHILLARIVEHVWRAGEQLDLPVLIRLLQKPPFQQVGVFELETFFPEKDRFALARTLNNIVAAPGFENWQEGTGLDVEELLYAADDRPQASIFYLAHLNDAQRAFFITLFLEAVRDWLRAQSGTTDLRALVYFDEVFGYFPPYPANPPTKAPLLALVKQGRAAGLGVVLSTQNPADLDYKGLTNAGTWAIGSLRAERDKERVLEGLEGAIAEAGEAMDRRVLDRALGALKPRVFLLHDIREGPPVFFHTRWAMSYLRGPLTRKQVRELARGQGDREIRRQGDEETGRRGDKETRGRGERRGAGAEERRGGEVEGLGVTPPALPPDVPQAFLPPTTTFEWALRRYEERDGRPVLTQERRLVYTPHLLALGTVRLLDRRRDVDHQQAVARLVQPGEGLMGVDWDQGEAGVGEDDLSSRPVGEGLYAPVTSALAHPRDLKRWEKDFADYLYHNVSVTILHNPVLKLYGAVEENRRDFRMRCEEEARQKRDAELKKARAQMDKQMARVQEKLRREKRELAEDEEEVAARKREEMLSLGETALNLFAGRRSSSAVSRASRKRTLTRKAQADVEESVEAIEDLEKQLEALAQEWEEQAAEINDRWADTLEEVEEMEVTPRRADVMVEFCGLAWVPSWQVTLEDGQRIDLPAREPATRAE